MKHTKGTRAAVVAATLLAAGLVAAGPANAAAPTGRISGDQLHASILKAAASSQAQAEILGTGPAGYLSA